jgi:hypothetical protein
MKLSPVFAIQVIIRNFQNETISILLESLEDIGLLKRGDLHSLYLPYGLG